MCAFHTLSLSLPLALTFHVLNMIYGKWITLGAISNQFANQLEMAGPSSLSKPFSNWAARLLGRECSDAAQSARLARRTLPEQINHIVPVPRTVHKRSQQPSACSDKVLPTRNGRYANEPCDASCPGAIAAAFRRLAANRTLLLSKIRSDTAQPSYSKGECFRIEVAVRSHCQCRSAAG